MKQVHKIVVFDMELTVRTDASEEQVRALAEYLQRKYDEVRSISQNIPRTNLMALAALNVASDYFDAQDIVRDVHRALEARSLKLMEKIERAGVKYEAR